ncbi:MAG TPA: pyridoxal phosphate-dependent aminotransferase [Candidatus Binatia bacterium]|jgi:aspartate aminotransferase|nr:pyridoxal phosphate-dependent aminotransferase [Candidatus Binatia bacterium]
MPLNVSERAKNVIASPIRKYAPLIKAAEDGGAKVIKLHIGDPDLDAPTRMLSALRLYGSKTLPYAPSSGLPSHVAAWQTYYKKLGVAIAPANIVPTAGCAEAIQLAMMAVTDPGDDLLCFEPLYTGFKAAARMFGVNLVPVPLGIENGFRLPSAAEIEARVTPKTKAVIVINPDNPTGKVWKKAELEAVLEVAARKGLFVIADETYREIVFTGRPSTMLSFKKHRDRVVVVDSLSKRFSIPGARMGAVVSFNADVMGGVLKFAMARLSTPTLEQLAVIPLLRSPETYVKKVVAAYRERRDAAVAALRKIKGVVTAKPEGAFYVVARLPVDDADRFVRFLINDFRRNGKTVTVTPIRDFYATPGRGANEVRVALVRPPKMLMEGMALLAAGLDTYKKKRIEN